MKTLNLYTVSVMLMNDVTENGQRYESELPLSMTVIATTKKEAIQKLLSTIPSELEATIVRLSLKAELLSDGSINIQMRNLLKGNVKSSRS